MKCFTGLFIILCLEQVHTIIFVLALHWKVLLSWYFLAFRTCAVEDAQWERIHYCLWRSILGSCIPLYRVNCLFSHHCSPDYSTTYKLLPNCRCKLMFFAWFVYLRPWCNCNCPLLPCLGKNQWLRCCLGNYGSYTFCSFLRNHCFIHFWRAIQSHLFFRSKLMREKGSWKGAY